MILIPGGTYARGEDPDLGGRTEIQALHEPFIYFRLLPHHPRTLIRPQHILIPLKLQIAPV